MIGQWPYRPGSWRSILGQYIEIMCEALSYRAALVAEPSSQGMARLVDRDLEALALVRAAGSSGGLL